MRALFWVMYLHRAEGARQLSAAERVHPNDFSTSQRPHLVVIPSHWALRFQPVNLGDTNIQTMHPGLLLSLPTLWKPNSLLPPLGFSPSQWHESVPVNTGGPHVPGPVLGQVTTAPPDLGNLLLSVGNADSPSHFPAAPREPRRPGWASVGKLPSAP